MTTPAVFIQRKIQQPEELDGYAMKEKYILEAYEHDGYGGIRTIFCGIFNTKKESKEIARRCYDDPKTYWRRDIDKFSSSYKIFTACEYEEVKE